jgi:hypothetical protein
MQRSKFDPVQRFVLPYNFSGVEGTDHATCTDLLRMLKAAQRKLIGVKPSAAKSPEGKAVPSEVVPVWSCTRCSDATAWASSLAARERRLLELLSDWKLLQSSERTLLEREAEVSLQHRQCTEMLERIRSSRDKLKCRQVVVRAQCEFQRV